MTEQINAYRKRFQDNVELALQYKTSRLKNLVTLGTETGAERTRLVLRAGKKNVRRRTTRYDPMTPGDTTLTQRWVDAYDWDIDPDLIDDLDRVRMGIDPSGYYTMAHAAGVIREEDQLIIDAIFADAKVGDNGGSTSSFDTTNMRVASGSTGMSVSKLVDAQRILLDQHVDIEMETPCVAVTPTQREELMRDIQVTSRDFNGGEPVLKNGRLVSFMGFNIVTIASDTEDGSDFGLPVTGSDRRCPFWVKSGMHMSTWQAPTTSITQREDLRGRPMQLYTKGTHGATRVDENKVGEILCTES